MVWKCKDCNYKTEVTGLAVKHDDEFKHKTVWRGPLK